MMEDYWYEIANSASDEIADRYGFYGDEDWKRTSRLRDKSREREEEAAERRAQQDIKNEEDK